MLGLGYVLRRGGGVAVILMEMLAALSPFSKRGEMGFNVLGNMPEQDQGQAKPTPCP